MNCPKTAVNYIRQLICLDKIMQIFHGIKIDRPTKVRARHNQEFGLHNERGKTTFTVVIPPICYVNNAST
jgi:hypothetical protein